MGGDVEAFLARPGDLDLVAFLLEGVLDPAGDRVLVFDDEDGGSHRWMLHEGRIVVMIGALADAWYPSHASGRLANSGPADEPQPA